jgi:hypothetical protein
VKLTRRPEESISIAFLDVITCGIGAIILLLMVARPPPPPPPVPEDDPRAAEISALQRTLFGLEAQARTLAAELDETTPRLAAMQAEAARVRERAAQAALRARTAAEEAAAAARVAGQLEVAQQRLTDEMRRLYAQRNRASTALVGGIPIDSEYIIFIIDTSGSMFNYAWPKVVAQIIETLHVYPRVKGLQIMNDEGSYMFPQYRGQWIPDTPAQRNAVIERLMSWNAFSNSSPVEGIYAAIQDFYSPDRKISLYIYGDEFTGRSIREVVRYVDSVNRRDAAGNPMVRIHAIGFPVQFANPPHLQTTGIRFAALMRELTRRNGGTFVGLNAFR